MNRDYDAGYRDGMAVATARIADAMRNFADYNEAEFGDEASAIALLRSFADMLDGIMDAT